MPYSRSQYSRDELNLSDVVFRHLDRMSANLIDLVNEKDVPVTSKFLTYTAAIQHYENILHPLFSRKGGATGYYAVKEKKIPPILPLLFKIERSPRQALEYFFAVSPWLKLLQTYAYNEQILQMRKGIYGELEADTSDD